MIEKATKSQGKMILSEIGGLLKKKMEGHDHHHHHHEKHHHEEQKEEQKEEIIPNLPVEGMTNIPIEKIIEMITKMHQKIIKLKES